ncbi:MAG: flagellar biosynthesis protein FlhB [Steroidobacteraceae bacterium]|jgi:flagellar biosynthetic protein FlhB
MAENDQDRTEQPTGKRLEEARKDGQVPRSADLSSAAVLLIAGAGLRLFGAGVGAALMGLMRSGLSLPAAADFAPQRALASAGEEVVHALLACAPILGLTVVAAFAAPLALGGWNFTVQSLAPDFTRLDPFAGFARVFSPRGAVELAKALAKFLLVAGTALLALRVEAARMLALGREPLVPAVVAAARLVADALMIMAGSLGLLAAIDVPWQLWRHHRELRMTREEVRDENRQSEGAPETKGRVRRAQRDLVRRRMLHEVPKANVIVTNPTHFAVALRYEENRMRAPRVIAKGADLIAARIRELATEHSVPVVEAPPLARALYYNVEIGGEIPAALYVAVAQVLTYIYRLKAARASGAPPPQPPLIDPEIETLRH